MDKGEINYFVLEFSIKKKEKKEKLINLKKVQAFVVQSLVTEGGRGGG